MTGNSGSAVLNADGADRTISWNQILPGNFAGSYYVLAKVNMLPAPNLVDENDPPAQTVNGNNVWAGNALDPNATFINLLPSNFPTTTLASRASGLANSANGYNDNPAISSDGRYVAFASDATNLVATDTNAARDIFLYDNQTTTVRLLSKSQQGVQGNAASNNPAISGDGRWVAFSSDATNLVIGDTNLYSDIFAVDTVTGMVTRISVSSAGAQSNGASFKPAISQDGRYVVFESTATNLIPGVVRSIAVVAGGSGYLVPPTVTISGGGATTAAIASANIDSTGKVTSITIASGGLGYTSAPTVAIAGGGGVGAVATASVTPAVGTAPGTSHIYLRNRDVVGNGVFDTVGNTETTLVDLTPGGVPGNGASIQAAISVDGSRIAFSSKANNLVAPATTAGRQHVYTRAVSYAGGSAVLGATTLVSVRGGTAAEGNADSQTPALSADGHWLAFASLASNLVANDTNGISDIFVYDTTAPVAAPAVVRVSVPNYNTGQTQGTDPSAPLFQLGSVNPSISADGRYVSFASLDNNLTAGDYAGEYFSGGTGATARATVAAGTVTAVNVTAPGIGYVKVAPIVLLTGGGGNNAQAVATIDGAGHVTSITVTNGGTGYTSAPTVVIDQGGDHNNSLDVFVRDRDVGATGTFDTPANSAISLVSVSRFGFQSILILGVPSTSASNVYPVISADGRFVAFPSDAENIAGFAFGATNLLPTDSNGMRDVFLFDRRINTTSPDNGNNPTVTVTNPGNGSSVLVNTATTLTAGAVAVVGVVANVQFYVNGTAQGAPITVFPYTTTWTPTAVGTYTLSAIVTDTFGNQGLSANATVTVSAAPTVSITSPASGAIVMIGAPQIVAASAAASTPGASIANVQLFANGTSLGAALTVPPYRVSWNPAAPGAYVLTALATDTLGVQTTSTPVSVTVSTGIMPTVGITSPATGSSYSVGTAITLNASAGGGSGSIARVQFFVNGTSLFVDTAAPYTTVWTPAAEGVYQLTAVATDGTGATTTSSTVAVLVVGADLNSVDTVYAGSYQGAGESGRFALINLHGQSATFIAYSSSQPTKIYFYPGIAVDAAGGLSLADAAGHSLLQGSVSGSGVSGTLASGANSLTFIGPITLPGISPVASGYYTGSISGNFASSLAAIVGADGSITLYVTDGSFRDAGSGNLTTTGSFSVTTATGGHLVGQIDPVTGFLTGTISGGTSGSLVAANGSGVSFSDGVLKSLSTRGQAGTGDNMLIAGFIVNGTAAKRMLIRAVGPTLGAAPFNVSGVLVDPQFTVIPLGQSVAVGGNDNWGGTAALQAAFAQAYAFALPAASKDAAAIMTLPPGGYTVEVSSVTGATGVVLVELYDLDVGDPFTAQKLIGVSTRGLVGAGDKVLIAGLNINGNIPKKVLVRAVGPTLANYGVSNSLSDPILTIKSGNATVRENDNWETGNDPALVAEATVQIGINALPHGSKDAVILMTLPPGLYTAVVSGANGATGIALVEVYEVP